MAIDNLKLSSDYSILHWQNVTIIYRHKIEIMYIKYYANDINCYYQHYVDNIKKWLLSIIDYSDPKLIIKIRRMILRCYVE